MPVKMLAETLKRLCLSVASTPVLLFLRHVVLSWGPMSLPIPEDPQSASVCSRVVSRLRKQLYLDALELSG